ncbi:hypothetical protein EMIHUDRAFT_437554 [Emiliania huxleyi CCMP1516]|uniref:NADH:ubiquinone oxidoreductase intermediate-associated protein 30 domain-containing protein n=2 Tax=Emiliania huxleyi TaxID=2903 RepID=A0A0D3IJX8_EMIH1|nr:hypothetical protein EMIHUDRAFT_437554 [Emiliania huxleyi CCMP1516]EOD11563.1 hypothetical protein EMIHUDRAFT_437554 [Emiliania huxleyi CCMP1516]|eukprot:XP_005763992.1 hypothetical protein EMIHUDRAFT_437554 [Emiliania huxleyi CCMP1516]
MLSVLLPLPHAYVPLVTFDGAASTTHKFTTESDPVMGGRSTSSWHLTKDAAGTPIGRFSGVCRIVPSLRAPGFVFALTGSPLLSSFPDASAEDGLLLKLKNAAGNVTDGYKFAFCDSRINPYRCQFGTFKADLKLAPASAAAAPQTLFVPWSRFSDKWSPATGEHTAEQPPKPSSLASITQLQVWVEGVAGEFALDVYEVGAGKASDLDGAPPAVSQTAAALAA